MKAITLWQPWASLLASGAKQFETRSWSISYRGPIAIHAGKRPGHELDRITANAIRKVFGWQMDVDIAPYIRELPHGCVIATAELCDCQRIEERHSDKRPIIRRAPLESHMHDNQVIIQRTPANPNMHELEITGNELLFGDWTLGRFAWEFAEIKMLQHPIPEKGAQRLWNWDGDVA